MFGMTSKNPSNTFVYALNSPLSCFRLPVAFTITREPPKTFTLICSFVHIHFSNIFA